MGILQLVPSSLQDPKVSFEMEEEVEMRDDENRIVEWEDGLPTPDYDLTPLFQLLITPELATAFSITPEPCRTLIDVHRPSRSTISSIQKQNRAYVSTLTSDDCCVEPENDNEKRKPETDNFNDDQSAEAAPTLKRARLLWTPRLHKRFIEVVGHLGIKNAVPKTIMQLMNVEGLTRENVASHLQKYRLYAKRMQGLSNEGPSSSDHLFASTPVPPPMPISMPYGHHPLMPLSMGYGFHPHHYNMFMEQQRNLSGNRFGSIVSHHHNK